MLNRYTSDSRPIGGINWVYPALAVVLAAAAFLRFWEIGGMFHFMGDEGTQTATEWGLIHGHLPLLGPSLSIGAMHLGPVFYYLMAIPLWIAGGSPVGPTVMVGVFGVGTVALLFFYLRQPLGDWPALGACAVMATSFLMVEYSRRPWNPTPTPFFTVLFMWSLVLWKRKSSWWLVLASGSLAILLQLQPVNIFLIGLFVVFVVLARPPMPSWSAIGVAIAVFLLISAPLIVYDVGHHLSNTQAWLDVLLKGKSKATSRSASSIRLLFNLFNRAFEPRVVVISIAITVVIVAAALYVGLVDHDADGANWEILLPLILLAIAAVGFEIYRKQVFEQYMVCLFIIPFVCLAALLRLLWKDPRLRSLASVVVVGLVAVGVRDTWAYSFSHPQVTVADAAVTSHDLQPDDVYAHVLKVDHLIETWSRGRPFRLVMASYLNMPTAYDYALERDGYSLGGHEFTFLLVEPGNWSERNWPPHMDALKRDIATSTRSRTIGIVKVYQVGRP